MWGVKMKKNGCASMLTGIIFFVLLFIFSETFLQGLNSGLLNCVRIVIPSLFPFLIASSLAGSGEIPAALKKILEPVTQFLFRLPADTLPAIILGQLGGYLSGTKAVQSLYSNGILSKSQSERTMLFSVNAGIGFSVNAVGNAMLCSREAGSVLLAALCISSLITGFAGRFLPDNNTKEKTSTKPPVPFSAAVVNSVNSASQAMLAACGFVAFFSGIGAITDTFIKSENLRLAAACLLEVTKGCADITGKVSLPEMAAVCAFGGLCVHMQIFSLTRDIGIKPFRFYIFRIIHAVSAYAVCRIILILHPVESAVFLNITENAEVFSFSAPAAISLLFLCFLLILDLDNSKKIC